MNTIVIMTLVVYSALAVAGSKIEATDGQNVTIYFNIDEVENADQVMITFKADHGEERIIAQIPWHIDPPPSGVSMDVGKGRVCVTIQKVSNSSSGIYEALALIREKMFEVKVQLVVKEASFSTTEVPTHSSPQNPPSSNPLQGLYALIPLVVVFLGGVLAWNHRRISKNKSQQMMLKTPEKPLLSSDPVSPEKENVAVIV